MQYVGEVFHEDSTIGQKRIEKYKTSACTYMMRTELGEIIDPTVYGNVARFMNHSCDPNCETRKWTVGKEIQVGIFARKNIREDEELTFDYQFDTFKTPFTKCYCGTAKCKGYLGLAVYDKAEDDMNSPVCKICKEEVATKDQLVVCKGSCDKVFHYDCLKTVHARLDRRNYYCPPCARRSKLAQKKLKEQEQERRAAAGHNSDDSDSDGNSKMTKRDKSNRNEDATSKHGSDDQEMKEKEEGDDAEGDDQERDNSSPTKSRRGRPKSTRVQEIAYFPIFDDPEAKRFTEQSAEHQLLDKVIHREIFQIDQA